MTPNDKLADAPIDYAGLAVALRGYFQIDEDGTNCGVSRQAVHEAADIIEALAANPAPADPLFDTGGIEAAEDWVIKLAADFRREAGLARTRSTPRTETDAARALALDDAATALLQRSVAHPPPESPLPAADHADYVLVPRVMPLDMEIAFCETWFSKKRCVDDASMQDAWDAALSVAPKPCPCNESTCTESWEPGCGLGNSREHAQPAPAPVQPDGSHILLAFGRADYMMSEGTSDGVPSVFIHPAKHVGKVGDQVPTDTYEYPAPITLTFPTPEQAKRVADALVNAAAQPPAPGEAELPALPEPAVNHVGPVSGASAWFNQDQMHAYARAAIAALRQPVDLGQFREAVVHWRSGHWMLATDKGERVRKESEHLLELIDSQQEARGNGE